MSQHEDQLNESDSGGDRFSPRVDRRVFLLAGGVFLLAGCSTRTTGTATRLPEVPWPERGYDTPTPVRTTSTDLPGGSGGQGGPHVPLPRPGISGLVTRTSWARGGPIYTQMNRMAPIRYITVHHDGMKPFTSTTADAAKQRLELIRRAHLGRGWADIGYHYVVDRGGRIYEARPISWQGAHVKNHNEGNIGVMALGNFEQQSPTEIQVQGVQRIVRTLMQKHRVSAGRVRTHLEWAATACPGRNLQPRIVAFRARGWV